MTEQPEQRPIGDILADIDALPLSRDPHQQMIEVKTLYQLLGEAGWDGGPGSRDGELRRHPETACVLLGVLDRMLPLFNDPDFTWDVPHHTRARFPKGYYEVEDPLFVFLIGEYLPSLPGYVEALVELVRRNPQAWSVEALAYWSRDHPGRLVNGVDIRSLLDSLRQIERPESVRRIAREFIGNLERYKD